MSAVLQRGCSVPGCDRLHCATGLCKLHYYRQRRNGATELLEPALDPDITEADVAWAAGFIDADGCILIGRSGAKFSPTVTGCSVDLEPLEELRRIFGGHVIHQRHRGSHVVRSVLPFYAWKCTNARAIWCARLLMPYLRIKSVQAYLLQCFVHEARWTKGGVDVRMPAEEITRREKLVEEVRFWNSRQYIRQGGRLSDYYEPPERKD